MIRQFDVIIEQDTKGYFVASVPTLPGCHTQAKSLDDLAARMREAIELCFDAVPGEIDFTELYEHITPENRHEEVSWGTL